jgi:hypothetical protein
MKFKRRLHLTTLRKCAQYFGADWTGHSMNPVRFHSIQKYIIIVNIIYEKLQITCTHMLQRKVQLLIVAFAPALADDITMLEYPNSTYDCRRDGADNANKYQ